MTKHGTKNQIVLALMQLPGISRKTIINKMALKQKLPSDIETIKNKIEEVRKNNKRIKEFSDREIQNALDKTERILANCSKLEINVCTYLDDDFPKLLKQSTDCPAVIYYKGDISYLCEQKAVAIVGTREPSDFGYKVGFKLGESFAKRGVVDVSGLAIGCDTAGHLGCLKGNGKTIAVLAGGLDKIYPASNKDLSEEIVNCGGALLSEYPPYENPYKAAFVERDRIQAALSNAVIVIETREKGGTMHAVRFAGEYNRYVYAFNHPERYQKIEQASGNQMLIREGTALPLTDDSDLEELLSNISKDYTEKKDTSTEQKEFVQLSLFDTNQ